MFEILRCYKNHIRMQHLEFLPQGSHHPSFQFFRNYDAKVDITAGLIIISRVASKNPQTLILDTRIFNNIYALVQPVFKIIFNNR